MNLIDAIKSGKPFKRKSWETYLIVEGVKFRAEETETYVDLSPCNITSDDWEIKIERKRYWIWKYKSSFGRWKKTFSYLNELGFDTSGEVYDMEWMDCEKQKIEDDYVDIEVEK